MIDKQKLLQWISDKRYSHEGPYEEWETDEDIAGYKGALKVLNWLEHQIELGEFNQEEREQYGRETNDKQSDKHIQEIQHEPEGSFLTTALHTVDPAFG